MTDYATAKSVEASTSVRNAASSVDGALVETLIRVVMHAHALALKGRKSIKAEKTSLSPEINP